MSRWTGNTELNVIQKHPYFSSHQLSGHEIDEVNNSATCIKSHWKCIFQMTMFVQCFLRAKIGQKNHLEGRVFIHMEKVIAEYIYWNIYN